MKKYEEYIQVDLPWLSEIPSHWYTQRAKAMFNKEKREVREYDDVITCFRDGVVTLRKNRRTTGFTESIQESGYQGIRAGDLIIHQMDAFAGATGVSDSDGKGTPVYSVCTPKGEYNNYYYAHIVREMAKTGFIQSLYRGIRERSSDFRFDVFGKQYLPIPTNEEQTQIVKYLDWKVAKINKYIKAKKRQIELLKELKQAEINRAVTKGLDPTVPMIDSGVDWIGKIPEHWEYRPIKSLFRSNQDSLNEKLDPTCNISYIDISSVGFGFLKLPPETYYFKDAPLRARRKVKEGDIIISTVRTYLKSMCYITSDLSHNIVSTGFSVLTPKAGVNSQYYQYGIFADYLVDEIIKKSVGISYPAINDDKLLSIKIVSPSNNDEKIIITEYLTNLSQKIDKAVSKVKCQLESIEEYKKSLISDVVTGKVDVREVVVPENYEVESIAEDIKDDGEVLETIN